MSYRVQLIKSNERIVTDEFESFSDMIRHCVNRILDGEHATYFVVEYKHILPESDNFYWVENPYASNMLRNLSCCVNEGFRFGF